MNKWRQLARSPLLDMGAIVIAIVALVRLVNVLPSRVYKWDFSHYYVSSRLLLEGRNPYEASLQAESRQRGFAESSVIPRATNPPPLLWLVAAFAWAPPRIAFWSWTTLQAVSLAVVLWLTRVLLRERLSLRGWRFVCAGVIASQAICYHFWFAQAQLLLVALVLGGFACARRGYWIAACAFATFAGMVKLFPLVLVPWFVWRGGGGGHALWRRVSVSIVVGFIVVGTTGWELWRDFFRFGATVTADFAVRRTFNFAVPSLVMNLYAVTAGQAATVTTLRVWSVVSAATGLMVVAVGYWLVWTQRRNLETEFCLLCVAMLAGSPVTWGHYFVFLIFPLAVAAVKLRNGITAARIIGFGLLLLTLNALDLAAKPWLGKRLGLVFVANCVPLAGLIALGCMFAAWLITDGESRMEAAPGGYNN